MRRQSVRCTDCVLTPVEVNLRLRTAVVQDQLGGIGCDALNGDCGAFARALGGLVGSDRFVFVWKVSPEPGEVGLIHVFLEWDGKLWDVDGAWPSVEQRFEFEPFTDWIGQPLQVERVRGEKAFDKRWFTDVGWNRKTARDVEKVVRHVLCQER